jgi:Na+/melibiose symporter-like transporter
MDSKTVVKLGTLLGLIIVGISLAVGGWAASEANSDEIWVFLSNISVPLGIGFLILVVTKGIEQRPS